MPPPYDFGKWFEKILTWIRQFFQKPTPKRKRIILAEYNSPQHNWQDIPYCTAYLVERDTRDAVATWEIIHRKSIGKPGELLVMLDLIRIRPDIPTAKDLESLRKQTKVYRARGHQTHRLSVFWVSTLQSGKVAHSPLVILEADFQQNHKDINTYANKITQAIVLEIIKCTPMVGTSLGASNFDFYKYCINKDYVQAVRDYASTYFDRTNYKSTLWLKIITCSRLGITLPVSKPQPSRNK